MRAPRIFACLYAYAHVCVRSASLDYSMSIHAHIISIRKKKLKQQFQLTQLTKTDLYERRHFALLGDTRASKET